MYGALNSKGDLMGGIFDRWINTIPESIVFNKTILPNISKNKKVQVITDYYIYDPASDKAGIASDVIGINVDNKPIPFEVFDNKWIPVKGMPQIEIKTNRRKHKMISLRNQGYEGKYLVFVETDFYTDYLVPLIKQEFYSDQVHNELKMNNEVFIISNQKGYLQQTPKIDVSKKTIGNVRMLYITTAKDFMSNAIECKEKEEIEYIVDIEERKSNLNSYVGKLKEFGELLPNGLFRFNEKWYKYTNAKGKSYRKNNVKTVDFYFSNLKAIEILEINKSTINVRASEACSIFNDIIEKNKIYTIRMDRLSRGNTKEYFISKKTIPFLENKENELLKKLKKIIDEN